MSRAAKATPLEERMKKTCEGQATWAEPLLGKTCTQCSHFTTNPSDTHRKTLPEGRGICTLIYKLNRKIKPKPYRGTAIACSQFKAEP